MAEMMDSEREAFEKAMESSWGYFNPERHPRKPDEYLKSPEHCAWMGWKAARAHRTQPAQAVDVAVILEVASDLREWGEDNEQLRLRAEWLTAALPQSNDTAGGA